MQTLSNKTAVITGGGRGLGEAICNILAKEGVRVAVLDINKELAEKVSEDIRRTGGVSHPFVVDLKDDQAVKETVGRINGIFGSIDILVNNAAIDHTVSVEELSVSDWDNEIGVNLRAPFILSKLVFPLMRSQKGGNIINIASTAAKRAWANASAYHASKWGLVGFSHALHVEGRPFGIKVTALISGGMRTPFLLDRFPDIDISTLQDPKNVAEVLKTILLFPKETVIPEIMVIPMKETSWP